MTLGRFERQLERDKLMIDGAKVVGQTVVGGLQALGTMSLAGAVFLGSILYGKDLLELKDNIVEMWPEGGTLLSPEWVAKWGANPDEVIEEDAVDPDNPLVKTIPLLEDGRTLEGLSAQDAYNLGSTGRATWYNHAKNNIIQWTYQEYLELKGWKSYNHPQGYGPNSWENTVVAEWHKLNPEPPSHLLLNQTNVQTQIRVTSAKRKATRWLGVAWWFAKTEPSEIDSRYIEDPMLDFLAVATYRVEDAIGWLEGEQGKALIWTDKMRGRAQRGAELIAIYAYWQP